MDMKTIDAYEEKYKYELPLIHKEFIKNYICLFDYLFISP